MAVGFQLGCLFLGYEIKKKKRNGWSVWKTELGFVLCGKPLAEEQCVKTLCLVAALE